MWRWRRAGVLSVLGVEPDLSSVLEAGRRVEKAGGGDRFFVVHAPNTTEKLCTFGDGAFGCASAMFSLHLMSAPDRSAVLREMARVVKPGGAVIACVPDGDAMTHAPRELVHVGEDGRARWNLDAPYFKRSCAPEAEPVLSSRRLVDEMRAAGFQGVTLIPFSSVPGFDALSEADRRVSSLYCAAVAYV